MPIPVTCSCGKKVNAPDKLAGKRAKCPACGEPLDIPAQRAGGGLDSLMAEEGMTDQPSCPKCRAALKSPDAVICVECGYDLKSGKQIKGVAGKQGGHAKAVNQLLAKAESELEETTAKAEDAYGKKHEEWVLFAIMMAVITGVVALAVIFFNFMEDKYADEEDEESRRPVAAQRARL